MDDEPDFATWPGFPVESTDGDPYLATCPRCGHDIRDLWDCRDLGLGSEVECDNCSGTLVVSDYDVKVRLELRAARP